MGKTKKRYIRLCRYIPDVKNKMKRTYLFSIILLFFSLSVLAQQTTYLSECNGQQTTIVWQEERTDERIYLRVYQGDDQHEYIINKSFQTEKWKVINRPAHTDLTIERHHDTYSVTGTFEGKRIAKTVESKGYVWYQNIAYNAGFSLNEKQTVKYECFRPDNMKLYAMVAEAQDTEKFEGMNAYKITVSLAGFLSVFWSCSYYFDPATFNFIGYKGVNGKPGTPETIIKIVR